MEEEEEHEGVGGEGRPGGGAIAESLGAAAPSCPPRTCSSPTLSM